MKAGRLIALLLAGVLAGVVVGRWAAREGARAVSVSAHEKREGAVVAVRSEPVEADEARASALPVKDESARAKLGVENRVWAASRAGNHEAAAALAAEAPEEVRAELLTAAYHDWGRREPEVALDAALMLDDPERRRVAFHAGASGWAKTDPRALAECARAFPEGPERSFALVAALRAWRRRDVAEAERWLAAQPVALLAERERALIAED